MGKHMVNLNQLRLLLLSLTSVFALHAPWQAPWILMVIALVFLWRYRLGVRQARLPSYWVLLPILLLCLVGVFLTFGRLGGRDSSIALFSLLMALKLMETKSTRDLTIMVHLGFFLTICTFLFSQGIAIAVLTVIPVILLTATLVALNRAPDTVLATIPLKQTLQSAATLLGLALPLLLALFVLFPRAPGPLWKPPKDSVRALSGLDEEMTPGKISDLTKSYAVAFRVDFQGQKPPTQSRLYWRGPVLSQYDGNTWRVDHSTDNHPLPAWQALSSPVQYTVTLEPHNRCWLYLLDLPVMKPSTGTTSASFSADFQLLSREPLLQRIRYDAASSLEYQLGDELSERERQQALQLPDSGDPRARRLAKQWAEENPDPQSIMQKALALFRSNFTYTLLAPPLGDNPNDDLIFNTRKGFCEHFSSSFVFLMRAAGVPARVVTGYQGGEFNQLGNYLIVRQSDAHAWAEIWLEKQGWVRVDPTAAVTPARVESGIAQALPENEPLPDLARMELTAPKRLNLAWDSVNNSYNQWILGYNQKRQTELLSSLTGSKVTRGDLAVWLVSSLILMVGLLAWFMLRPAKHKLDAVQAAWQDFRKKLGKAGIPHQPEEGPRDFALRASTRLPASKAAITRILQHYLDLRYGAQQSDATVRELQTMVKQFKPQ